MTRLRFLPVHHAVGRPSPQVADPLPGALGPLSQITSPTTARTAAGPKKITKNCGNVIVSIFRLAQASAVFAFH
jgi:hypothetical protein